MKRRIVLIAAVLCICICALIGCEDKLDLDGDGKLSAEELEEIRDSLQQNPGASDPDQDERLPQENQTPPTDNENEENKTVFYYTDSGEVYHSNRECGHLKNSKNVNEGTLSQIQAAGKTRLCSACAKDDEENNTPPADDDEDTNDQTPPVGGEDDENKTVCYYTPNGDVWHLTKECGSLKNTQTIMEGSIEDAKAAGKSRVCNRCGD